jgi:hypothetical protein
MQRCKGIIILLFLQMIALFLIVFIEVRANTLRHSHNQGCSHVPKNDDSDEFPLY